MACKHVCSEPCAISHVCRCTCEMASRLDDLRLHNECQGSTAPLEGPSPYPETVRHYQAFASGGAKEHDALLLKKATETAAAARPTPGIEEDEDLLPEASPQERDTTVLLSEENLMEI